MVQWGEHAESELGAEGIKRWIEQVGLRCILWNGIR